MQNDNKTLFGIPIGELDRHLFCMTNVKTGTKLFGEFTAALPTSAIFTINVRRASTYWGSSRYIERKNYSVLASKLDPSWDVFDRIGEHQRKSLYYNSDFSRDKFVFSVAVKDWKSTEAMVTKLSLLTPGRQVYMIGVPYKDSSHLMKVVNQEPLTIKEVTRNGKYPQLIFDENEPSFQKLKLARNQLSSDHFIPVEQCNFLNEGVFNMSSTESVSIGPLTANTQLATEANILVVFVANAARRTGITIKSCASEEIAKKEAMVFLSKNIEGKVTLYNATKEYKLPPIELEEINLLT